jgi:hypothetical protein
LDLKAAHEFVNQECTGQCSCSPPSSGDGGPGSGDGGPDSGDGGSGNCLVFVSYNVAYNNQQGVTGPGNAIKQMNADIVGTQETQDKDGLARTSGRALVGGTDFQNPMYYDSNKASVTDSGWEMIPDDDHPGWRTYTWATFSTGGKRVSLFNTHLPHKHGESAHIDAHKQVAETIASKAQTIDGCKVIVGDMNPHAGNFKGEITKLGFKLAAESRSVLPGYDQIWVSSECGAVSNTGDGPIGGSDHVPVHACISV